MLGYVGDTVPRQNNVQKRALARVRRKSAPLYSFHRPLSEYIRTLLKHEFMITGFEETTPSKQAIEKHYREFGDEYEPVPWFLVIGSKKQ
ncbi:MAG: hypothetical protein ABSB28_07715 [Candidatus Bathyarchaeia archaeon]